MSSIATIETVPTTPECTTPVELSDCEEVSQPVKRRWETIELRADSITGQKMKSMQGVIPSFMNGRDVNLQPGATIYSPACITAEKKNNRKASKKRRQGRKKVNSKRTNASNTSNETDSDMSLSCEELIWNTITEETTYEPSMIGVWF